MPDGVRTAEPLSPDEFAGLVHACLPEKPRSLAVAVSGGADSMALCLLAHAWAVDRGLTFTALTVDHGLRPNSDQEACQVGAWLNARGIAHHILTWTEGTSRTGAVQERARQARYGLMRDWCRDNDVNHLLVAHHMEDQAETVLMRLSKGSGLMGLAAMARVRDMDGVALVRPLLDTPKARLRATLQAAGQDWVEDPSNQNPAFERVRVRRLLNHLQTDGVSAERLAGAARACAVVRDVLDRAADVLLATTSYVAPDGALHIQVEPFLKAPRQVRERTLIKVLNEVGGREYPPHRVKLERLMSWMVKRGDEQGPSRTLTGCEVRLKRGEFRISSEAPRKGSQKGQKRGANAGINYEPALALKG